MGQFPLDHVRIGASDLPSSPGVAPLRSQPIDDSWDIWMGPLLPAMAESVAVPDEPFGNREGVATLVEQFRDFRMLARIALDGASSEDWKEPAGLAALLLYDMTSRDAKNELLKRKLFAALFGGSYRAHYGDSAYSYDRGSWG